MFNVIPFIIAKYWEQLKCAAVQKWLTKLWYIYVIQKEEYIAIKNHAFNIMFQNFNDMENFYNKIVKEKVEHQIAYIIWAQHIFFKKDTILVTGERIWSTNRAIGCPPPKD